jgi:hypothetical protein
MFFDFFLHLQQKQVEICSFSLKWTGAVSKIFIFNFLPASSLEVMTSRVNCIRA